MVQHHENETVVERENRVKKWWQQQNIFRKSITQREGQETFVFYEGPPTANGLPHAGHVLGRVIKDFVARYKTMQGFQVLRKAGWDTHGLPVELGVEKKLGISGKQEIEAYGVEKFIEACKDSVFDYEKQWRKFTEAIGYWVDMDDPYVTLENNYIESVWYILATIHKKGLLDKGHRVTPYCPSCQTSLSSHEVAQGYKNVKDLSVTVKFPLKDAANTFFLGWTTTPWTLPGNIALAVHPDMDYVKVQQNQQVFIVAADRLQAICKEADVLSWHKGKEFVGLSYQPPFPMSKVKRGYQVIGAQFVTNDSGTGIVHVAPAYGEDDYHAVEENNLDFIHVVDETGRYKEDMLPLKGQLAKQSDVAIIKMLAEKDLLFAKEKYEHSYPHCWRCDSPLLYYAMEGWFIRTTAIKDTILQNNEQIEWHPEHMKHGRFGNFLENMVDWNLGRNRYWGTPLNVWICQDCEHQVVPKSIQELQAYAKDPVPDSLELHKPYVDKIVLCCPHCHSDMYRTKEVIDVWFDSGSMPFAQYHYPFANKELFEKQFPADIIAEGVDQTRGWFYSLLTVASLFDGKPSYKRVLSLGHILDEDGKKMSKSKGNVIDPMQLVETYGADALRWALLADSAPWNNKRFSANLVAQAKSKVVDTLQNVYAFYAMYTAIDQFDPHQHDKGEQTLLDKWVLSRQQTVVNQVNHYLDAYEFTSAAKVLAEFVDQVSNWYIRRSRDRFWGEGMGSTKLAAYHTLREVLITTSKLLAPFIPFVTEDIHVKLTGESVHLVDFPSYDETAVNDQLEKEMSGVGQVVELARQARNESKIKTKQPLASLTVVSDALHTNYVYKYADIIKEEINVKRVDVATEMGENVRYEVKLNFPVAGPKLGKQVGIVQKRLQQLPEDAITQIVKGDRTLTLPSGETLQLEEEDLLVKQVTKKGLEMATNPTFTVLLDTQLTEELKQEGLARELIRAVQLYRKELNLPVDQRVNITFAASDEMKTVINSFQSLLETNLLLKAIHFGERAEMKSIQLENETVRIGIH